MLDLNALGISIASEGDLMLGAIREIEPDSAALKSLNALARCFIDDLFVDGLDFLDLYDHPVQ